VYLINENIYGPYDFRQIVRIFMYKYSSNDAVKFNIAFENVSRYLVTSRSIKKLCASMKNVQTVNVLSPFAFGRSGKPGSAYDVDPLLLCETCTSWQYSTYR